MYYMRFVYCIECKEYRKNGNSDWWECEKKGHKMYEADEKFTQEKKKNIDIILKGEKYGHVDEEAQTRLGILSAIENSDFDPKDETKRAAMILSEMIEKYSKVPNDDNTIYFWIKLKNGRYKTFRHDSENLIRLLVSKYEEKYSDVLKKHNANNAIYLHTSKGQEYENVVKSFGKRMVMADGVMWYDLRDRYDSIYKITEKVCGPSIPYSPSMRILFDRDNNGTEMPLPEQDDSENWIDWFCDLARIPADMKMLFKIHLCHYFCMWEETPFMFFYGPYGSGKSFTAELVKEMVDPVGFQSVPTPLPKDEKVLSQILTKDQVRVFDNVGYISPEISNILCLASTGGSLTTRELYTTNNMLTITYGKMRIILTSLSNTSIKMPDLKSRILNYELPVRNKKDNKSKNLLREEFEKNRPFVLYYIFEILSKAMAEYNKKKDYYDDLDTTTRMNDFETFGRVIGKVLGDKDDKAIKQYQRIMKEDMVSLVSEEPIVYLIGKLMDVKQTKEYYELTRTFFTHIKEIAETDDSVDENDKSFPKSVSKIKPCIDTLKGALLERGFYVEINIKIKDIPSLSHNRSHIYIRRIDVDDDSTNSNNSDNKKKNSNNQQNKNKDTEIEESDFEPF